MVEIRYVCKGSCRGVASQEQWEAGSKECGDVNCELYGEPLQKRMHCEKCDEEYMLDDVHTCE